MTYWLSYPQSRDAMYLKSSLHEIIKLMIGSKCHLIIFKFLLIGMYKCNSMGLLPTHVSDWLAFADPLTRAEVALGGLGFR